jgi:hypothetical protein
MTFRILRARDLRKYERPARADLIVINAPGAAR